MGDVGFIKNMSTTSGGFHKWAPKMDDGKNSNMGVI